eukprot:450658-Pelagomonas_calceolata.AAC.1
MRGYRQWQARLFREGCTGVEGALETDRMLEVLSNSEHIFQLLCEKVGVLLGFQECLGNPA